MDQKELHKRLKKIDEALLKYKPRLPDETLNNKSIWTIAIDLVSHMIAGAALGYAIDSLLGSRPKAVALCSLLSLAACFYKIIRPR